ncbi:hypothetical protein RSAG8_00947, partial [Rhizoctonia solani AG-8 WAC10335]
MSHYALGGAFQPWTQEAAKEHRLLWSFRLLSNPFPLSTQQHLFSLDPGSNDLCDLTEPADLDMGNATILSGAEPEVSRLDSSNIPFMDDLSAIDFTPASLEPTETLLCRLPAHTSTLIQTKLSFPSTSIEEKRARDQQSYYNRQAERQEELEHAKIRAAKQVIKTRKQNRIRKRVERARKKAHKVANTEAKVQHLNSQNLHKSELDSRQAISALSRPYSAINAVVSRKAQGIPSKHATELVPTHRINWSEPLIASIIDNSAQRVGFPWSPTAIVQECQRVDPVIFASLRPQRISDWRDHRYPHTLRWTEARLQAIKVGRRPNAGERRGGIFVRISAMLKYFLW